MLNDFSFKTKDKISQYPTKQGCGARAFGCLILEQRYTSTHHNIISLLHRRTIYVIMLDRSGQGNLLI